MKENNEINCQAEIANLILESLEEWDIEAKKYTPADIEIKYHGGVYRVSVGCRELSKRNY